MYLHLTGLHKLQGGNDFENWANNYGESIYTLINDEFDQDLLKNLQSKLMGLQQNILQNSSDGQQYLMAIVFINKFIRILNYIETLFDTVEYKNQISITPKFSGIFVKDSKKSSCNIISLTNNKKATHISSRRIFGTAFVFGIVAFLGGNVLVSKQLIGITKSQIEQNGQAFKNNKISKQIYSKKLLGLETIFQDTIKSSMISSLYPSQILMHAIKKDISNEIYASQLIPMVQESMDSEQVAYLLFIIHSNNIPKLQAFILKYIDLFANISNIPAEVIKQYIEDNGLNRNFSFKGNSVHDMPLLSAQQMLNNLSMNLQMLNENKVLTLQNINEFYQTSYINFAGQIVLKAALSEYYKQLVSKLFKGEEKFLYQLRVILGNYTSNADEAKALNLIHALAKQPAYTLPKIQDFRGLMGAISQIISKEPKVQKSKLFKQSGTFSSTQWHKIITRAKINTLINDYFQKANIKFVKNKVLSGMPGVSLNSVNSSNLFYNGVDYVEPIYTSAFILNVIVPDIDVYKKIAKNMKNAGIDVNRFQDMFNRVMNEYTDKYIISYQNLISRFDYNADSLAGLRVLLHQFITTSSPLVNLINVINQNTLFDKKLDKYSFIKNISQYFSSYHKLKDFSQASIEQSPLQGYLNIIATLKDQLLSSSEKTQKASLSLTGNQALAIYLKDQNSYMEMTNMALNKVGMPINQRKPFLKVFSIVYSLGMQDLQEHLNDIWQTKLAPITSEIESAFPMKLAAKNSMTPKRLTLLLAPKTGQFWDIFNHNLSKLLVLKNGIWMAKTVPYANKLPLNSISKEVNKLYQLTHALWNKDGTPKPLSLELSALPFYQGKIGTSYVQMTYLSVDDQSIFGVNGMPITQEINYKWWKDGSSSLGYTLEDKSTHELSERGYWAFYKLMKMSRLKDGNMKWDLVYDKKNIPVNFQVDQSVLPLKVNYHGA